MSAPCFICVGGPLDGQWKAWNAPSFCVEELPEPIASWRVPTGPDRAIGPVSTIRHRYVLSEHEEHGTAWVHQA